MTKERDTKAAFLWIVGLLEKHAIPFQIAGGFAARLYGAARELADIDIGIPDNRIAELYPEVKEHVIFGPARFQNDFWDLNLITLRYKNQEIDISGEDDAKMFDKDTETWVHGGCDLATSVAIEVYGITVPVIPKEALIAYKSKIMREVDRLDLEALRTPS